MSDIDPKEFGILINKVEALTDQLAYTNKATEKNLDRLFIQMAAYLESNNARHDEADERAVRDKAELIARIEPLEKDKQSFSDKMKGALMATKWIGVLAFGVLVLAVKGAWEGVVWIGEWFLGR